MTTPIRLSADTRLLASLEDYEQKIKSAFRRGLEATCSIAAELGKIQAGKLYEQRGYATFGDYVRDHLGIARQTMERIISISETVDLLKKAGLALPMNETQAVELGRLEPDQRPHLWSGLLSEAERTEQILTAEDIRRAVDQFSIRRPPQTGRRAPIEIEMTDNGDEPPVKEKKVKGVVVPEVGLVLTEKGEAALARIQKLCGPEVAQAIENGSLPLSEKEIKLWAEQDEPVVKALLMYVADLRWTVSKAIAFESQPMEADTDADTMITIARARGGTAILSFGDRARITVEITT